MIRQDMLLFCTSLRVAIATGKNFCTVSVLNSYGHQHGPLHRYPLSPAIPRDRHFETIFHDSGLNLPSSGTMYSFLSINGSLRFLLLLIVEYNLCLCRGFCQWLYYRVVRRHQRVIALQRAVRARSPETRPISLLRFKRSFVICRYFAGLS